MRIEILIKLVLFFNQFNETYSSFPPQLLFVFRKV